MQNKIILQDPLVNSKVLEIKHIYNENTFLDIGSFF